MQSTFTSNKDARSIRTTWKDTFLAASGFILSEQSEQHIANQAVWTLLKQPDAGIVGVDEHDVIKVRIQLEALDLIKAASKTHPNGATWLTWFITDKGRRYLSQEMAIKREREE